MPTKSTTGSLRHRIKIRRHSDIPAASMGLDPQFDAGIDRWADKQQVSAATYYASAQVGDQVTHWFVLRAGTLTRPEDLTTDLVIDHGGRRYRISRAREHPDDDQFTAVEAIDLGRI
jgi:hypothetical protein